MSLDFFGLGGGRDDGGATADDVESLAMLADQIRNAPSATDQLEVLAEAKSVAKRQRQQFGVRGIGALAELLRRQPPLDPEATQAALEVLLELVSPPRAAAATARDREAATANANRLCIEPGAVEGLLAQLGSREVWVRLMTVQLLAALHTARSEALEAALLRAPAAMGRLLDLLDDKREEVRGELLLLLTSLTRRRKEIQSFVAFEGLERLLRTALSAADALKPWEALVSTTPTTTTTTTTTTLLPRVTLAQDCLRIVANCCHDNDTACRLLVHAPGAVRGLLAIIAASSLPNNTTAVATSASASPLLALASAALAVIEQVVSAASDPTPAASTAPPMMTSTSSAAAREVAKEPSALATLATVAAAQQTLADDTIRTRALAVLAALLRAAPLDVRAAACIVTVPRIAEEVSSIAPLDDGSVVEDATPIMRALSLRVPGAAPRSPVSMVAWLVRDGIAGVASWLTTTDASLLTTIEAAIHALLGDEDGDDLVRSTLVGYAISPPPPPPSALDEALDPRPPVSAVAVTVAALLAVARQAATARRTWATVAVAARASAIMQAILGSSFTARELTLRLGVAHHAASDPIDPSLISARRPGQTTLLTSLVQAMLLHATTATDTPSRSEAPMAAMVCILLARPIVAWTASLAAAAAEVRAAGLESQITRAALSLLRTSRAPRDARGMAGSLLLVIALACDEGSTEGSLGHETREILDALGVVGVDSALARVTPWHVSPSRDETFTEVPSGGLILVDASTAARCTAARTALRDRVLAASLGSEDGKETTSGPPPAWAWKLLRDVVRLQREGGVAVPPPEDHKATNGIRAGGRTLRAPEAESLIAQLTRQRDEADARSRALLAELTASQRERTAAEAESRSLRSVGGGDAGTLSELKAAYDLLREQFRTTRLAADTATTERDAARAQLSRAQADLAAVLAEGEVDHLKDRAAAAEARAAAAEAEVATLQSQLEDMKEIHESHQADLRVALRRAAEADERLASLAADRSNPDRDAELAAERSRSAHLLGRCEASEQQCRAVIAAKAELEVRMNEALATQEQHLAAARARISELEADDEDDAEPSPIIIPEGPAGVALEALRAEHEELLVLLATQDIELSVAYEELFAAGGAALVDHARKRAAEQVALAADPTPEAATQVAHVLAELTVMDADVLSSPPPRRTPREMVENEDDVMHVSPITEELATPSRQEDVSVSKLFGSPSPGNTAAALFGAGAPITTTITTTTADELFLNGPSFAAEEIALDSPKSEPSPQDWNGAAEPVDARRYDASDDTADAPDEFAEAEVRATEADAWRVRTALEMSPGPRESAPAFGWSALSNLGKYAGLAAAYLAGEDGAAPPDQDKDELHASPPTSLAFPPTAEAFPPTVPASNPFATVVAPRGGTSRKSTSSLAARYPTSAVPPIAAPVVAMEPPRPPEGSLTHLLASSVGALDPAYPHHARTAPPIIGTHATTADAERREHRMHLGPFAQAAAEAAQPVASSRSTTAIPEDGAETPGGGFFDLLANTLGGSRPSHSKPVQTWSHPPTHREAVAMFAEAAEEAFVDPHRDGYTAPAAHVHATEVVADDHDDEATADAYFASAVVEAPVHAWDAVGNETPGGGVVALVADTIEALDASSAGAFFDTPSAPPVMRLAPEPDRRAIKAGPVLLEEVVLSPGPGAASAVFGGGATSAAEGGDMQGWW